MATTGTDVYRIAGDGTKVHLNSAPLPFSTYGIGVDAAGDVVLLDYYNKRLQKLDGAGHLSVLANLPGYAQILTTDLAGRITVRMDDGHTLYAIDAAGAATQIPLTLNEQLNGLSTSQDGKLIAWTNYDRAYAIDPATGAATLLLGNAGTVNGMTRDASGMLYICDYNNDELRGYDSSGNLAATFAGFVTPGDIVWTGTDLKFVDAYNRFFSLSPGAYPRRLGSFSAYYLGISNGEVYGSSSNSVLHWNGSAGETWQSMAGANFTGGIAARADGALTVADNVANRVITFDASKKIVSDYAGMVQPMGLAFDAQGRLYVANYGANSIVRFDIGSGTPTLFAQEDAPRFLAFDGSGKLWVSGAKGVDTFDSTGVATSLTTGAPYNGLLIDGATALAVDGTYGLVRRWDGQNWNVFAAGLSSPQGVYADPSGDVYVANRDNGTVTRYSQNGALSAVGGNLPAVTSVRRMPDGNIYAGGESGLLYQLAPDGTQTDVRVSGSVDYLAFYGLAPGANANTFYGVVSGYNSGAGRNDDQIVSITRTQPPTPPPAGTVVYHTTVPMPAMPAADGYTHFDLGSWLPPYGGDFRIDVARTGVDGGATNFVHVGPAAYGSLSALEPELPPGDQTESMCLSVAGADFTSISRVEAAQVRPLVNIIRPFGMAADKAGNIYYTTNDSLYKTTSSGQTTQVAGGLSFRFGLAADSNENLYATSYSSATASYHLLKFDPAGNESDVADLHVNLPNGVQVDSHDNVLVGAPGQLLKVDAHGNVSVLSRQGLPVPRGLAIDGKDNVYVQNDTGYVSLIRPDGSSSDIFTSNDGVEDPYLEGDTYPNIAADCSDNFYIAPYRWAKLGPVLATPQEEHTLSQIIPRTGQMSLLFDTLKISPALSDIDYLSFDRFGSRIMMWNEGDGRIWQVPVTCGAIGVNAHVVTQPGQTLSGATVPTSSVIARADGGKEYVWSLKDVAASGQQVCFDTQLKGLALGETRPTLASSYITFQNSFAANAVQEALNVPSVHVANLVQVAVATDQPEYPAQATAQVTTMLTNTNPTIVGGTLVVNVYDAGGAFVGGVTRQNVSIPALGSLPVPAPFAIGAIVPAQYTVTAVLSNNGLNLAQGQTTFDVLPSNATASATSFVHTDKQSYNPNDQVTITSRAQSLSANIVLGNLTVMVQVVDGSGAVQFTHGFPIAQLLPGATLDFSTPEKLGDAAPGIYTVKQDLFDEANHVLSHVEAAYNVAATSDTGFGLTGTIAAAPKSVEIGQTLTLNASVVNQGNSALANLPLTISLVDPGSGTVLQSFTQNVNVPVGASVPFAATWTAQGNAGATYFAVLGASVGSGASAKTLTLAVDTYALTAPAFHLDAAVTLSATPPPLAALVLVDPSVSSAETARIAAALTSIGYVSTFVTTQADFAKAFGTGAYQHYLLLASSVAPDATTLRLLREGVHRGEGLIVANGAAPLPDVLAQVTGLTASTSLPVINAQAVDALAAAPGGAGHEAFAPSLASRIVTPQIAQTLATLTGRLPATPDAGALSDELAAHGRVDIGYYGNDAGTNGTHLSLTALGRLLNADGSSRATVWRIRNSGASARNVVLASTDGTYSLALTITPQTDTFVASTDVASPATHALREGTQTIQTAAATTATFVDTRQVEVGDNPGAIALWANAVNATDALDWSGAQHQLHGAVHSNSDIRLSGAQNLIDGPVHYATSFTNSGSQNTFTYLPRAVAPQPLPTLLNLDDFKPGGAVAAAVGQQYFDQTAECTSKHTWQRSGSSTTLAAGVYWIPCDVHISGSNTSGTVTLVSTGSIQIDGAKGAFQAFYQGLQFASSQSGANAIALSGSSMQVGGLVFAPHGTMTASGSSMNFQCAIIADQIRLAGAKTTVDPRQCAYATVQRQAPAVLWNMFGGGVAAYAAFDWQGAIGQYEAATPGVLAKLFGGVLAHVAPGSLVPRAGTVMPVTASVQNKADPFTGQLTLGANDDSTFVPATTSWALDFTSRNAFQAQSNVRLGSGTSTGLTATVSAATPIVANRLAQGTLSLAHLPGESIGDLVGAVGAVANPDAGLTAARTALQAAQASLSAGDRQGAVGHLLDAAEDCGISTNAQADALRTRIDWVIWATTH
ncbi:MAG TPA: hypothetical protein VFB32_12095 [Rudaea sp.]|nr:hypothetical protein [Rudaea sp.]